VEQADASVSVERAQARCRQVARRRDRFRSGDVSCGRVKAPIGGASSDRLCRSAVYRLAELERGGNARAASRRLRPADTV